MKILKFAMVGIAVLVAIALLSPREPSGRAADVRPHVKPVPPRPINYDPIDIRPFAPDVPADDDFWGEDDATPISHQKSRWHSSWSSAKAESDRTGRPIFVDLRMSPCVYCDQVDRAIAELSVDTKLNDFVCLKVDRAKDAEHLAAQLGVAAFPTLVVAKPDGSIVSFRQGSADSATIRADLAKAFAPTPTSVWVSTSAACPNGICPAGTVCGPIGCSGNGCNCTTYATASPATVVGAGRHRILGGLFGRSRCSGCSSGRSAPATSCSGCSSSGGGRSCGR